MYEIEIHVRRLRQFQHICYWVDYALSIRYKKKQGEMPYVTLSIAVDSPPSLFGELSSS